MCSEKISREHYISANLLRANNDGRTAKIGGLRWQPNDTLQDIGISSLQSKILCETHNVQLSDLDTLAGSFFRVLNAADKNPESLPALTQIDGHSLERWLLKVICGLVAANGKKNDLIPNIWKDILVGGCWPEEWGLYFPSSLDPQVLANEFFIQTFLHPDTRVVLASTFRIAGVCMNFALGRPSKSNNFWNYRPRGIIFQLNKTEKRVEFIWPFDTNEAIIYTKVGSTKERPPQWQGWKD